MKVAAHPTLHYLHLTWMRKNAKCRPSITRKAITCTSASHSEGIPSITLMRAAVLVHLSTRRVVYADSLGSRALMAVKTG